MTMHFDSSGLDLVEILGEFIGDDVGDDLVGDALDRAIAGDDLVGALRRPPVRRQPNRGAALQHALAMRAKQSTAQALKNAIAERRAQAGALIHDRTPSKSREYPLGFVSAAPIAAGGSARITTRPQVPFRLDRLTVPSDIAGLFTIDDVKVGKNSQFAAEGAVPARIFQENAVGVCLKGDTAQISMDVTISVTNISGASATFRAAVIGPAVE